MKKNILSIYTATIGSNNLIAFLSALAGIMLIFFSIGNLIGLIPFSSLNELVVWDAGWYRSIVEDGYKYEPGKQCNIAFFPLFPFLWKYLHLSAIHISLLNGLFYFISLGLIGRFLDISNSDLSLYFFLPSVMFCFVPFSESVFYLSSTIALIGLYRNSIPISLFGLFLCGLSRSISVVFIPIILFSQFPYIFRSHTRYVAVVRTFKYVLTMFLSIIVVAFIQFLYTNRWFDFFEVQRYWNKSWQFPVLPLTTWGFGRIGWLDGTAILVSLIAVMIACILLFQTWKKRLLNTADQSFLFSTAYLSAAGLIAMFYGNTDETTSVLSINRYIFATPFAGLFFAKLKEEEWPVLKGNTILFVFWILGLFLFGITSPYGDKLRGLIYLSAYFIFFYTAMVKKKFHFITVLFIHLVLFLFLFKNYLAGFWIG